MSHMPTKDWRWPEGASTSTGNPAAMGQTTYPPRDIDAEFARLRRDRDELAAALEEAANEMESFIRSEFEGTKSLASHLRTVEPWRALIARIRGGHAA